MNFQKREISVLNGTVCCGTQQGVRLLRCTENYVSVLSQLFLPILNVRSIALVDENTVAYCCYANKDTSPSAVYIQKVFWEQTPAKELIALEKQTVVKTEKMTLRFPEEIHFVNCLDNKLIVVANTHIFVYETIEFRTIETHPIVYPLLVDATILDGNLVYSNVDNCQIQFVYVGGVKSSLDIDKEEFTFVRILNDNYAIVGTSTFAYFHALKTRNKQIKLSFDTTYIECVASIMFGKYCVIVMRNADGSKMLAFNTTVSSTTSPCFTFELVPYDVPCFLTQIQNDGKLFLVLFSRKSFIFFDSDMKFVTQKTYKIGRP
ncbi:hypothetical protein EIN_181230 [Entamoeba invadens IP1]|uniref:hypothetical protein n=1 Tax=Entamoeba invadens IP1 TaxID=370355 RepID=UPI0002C3D492|nr:hypothetical protein EIN_181230 [Entamoeba invadens IP1]ELP93966.1 hypothetical protein EIN_181230 [Entamoeba invadens IP1]|eukprot:XP_004260737.1 hypothetical protein EIN_181230 [Entamoeba invadens IP1]